MASGVRPALDARRDLTHRPGRIKVAPAPCDRARPPLIFIGGPFTGASEDAYRRILATHLDGFFHATQAAIEYAGRNIRVSAVSPGVAKTPMHAPGTHEALAATHPLGRLGEIADVVRAVLSLEDSPFVTGEILHVDGGWTAGG